MDELQRLRDRIEVLETLLGLDEGDVSLIQQVTGLGPVQAKILSVLRKRRGVVWSKQMLFEVLYGDRPECDRPHGPNVIGETVAKVRAKLHPLGMDLHTIYGAGYSMSEETRAKLTALMHHRLDRAA